MTLTELINYLKIQIKNAQLNNIRLPILLHGTPLSARLLVNAAAEQFTTSSRVFLYNDQFDNNVWGKKANFVIGKEFQAGFCQLGPELDPNLCGALSGTILGGGIWIFDATELTRDTGHSLFLSRIDKLLNESKLLTIQCETNTYTLIDEFQFPTGIKETTTSYAEQDNAIKQILDSAISNKKQHILISAARGRGKSAAIGIACGKLARQGYTIILTAPSINAATVVFKHFQMSAPDEKLHFTPPDDLLLKTPDADLLVIDEAASFPTPTLQKLVEKYSRIIFATTTIGYEGTGKGFSLRFIKSLTTLDKSLKFIELETPIRWSPTDPLEPLINRLFLLDVKTKAHHQKLLLDKVCINEISRDDLWNEQNLLEQFIGLLQLAHYKTRPSDLKQLLDNPDQKLFTATLNNKLIGLCLCIREGPLNPELSKAIYQGKRRPIGNLIPQSLLYQHSCIDAGNAIFMRIVRIAVHPDLQGNGIGKKILTYIEKNFLNKKIDALGCSFGATSELVHFWQSQGYKTMHIGIPQKTSSGAHSLLMLKPYSEKLQTNTSNLQQKFFKNFILQLGNKLQTLDVDIILQIFQDYTPTPPSQDDWQAIYHYAFLNKNQEDCLWGLRTCLLYGLAHYSQNNKVHFALLISSILQGQSDTTLCKLYHFTGKKQFNNELKSQFAKLLIEHAEEKTKEIILANQYNRY